MKFLDKRWLQYHLKQIKQKAQNRYTPELNIDLPIAEIFDGLSRTNRFYSTIRTHYGKLGREFRLVSSRYESKEIQKLYNQYSEYTLSAIKLLARVKEYSTRDIPWKRIYFITNKANEYSWRLSDKLREERDKPENKKAETPESTANYKRTWSDRFNSDIHYLYEAQKELRYFNHFAESTSAKASNNPFLLLTGLAGTGKTHLLCDVVKNRIDDNFSKSVLVFGEFFDGPSDYWLQIGSQIGLSGKKYNKHQILKLLNHAGATSRNRSLLIVDALNESKPINYWRKNLTKLYRDISKYPNIGLVVSVRSGFEKEVLTKGIEKLFIKEEHRGFEFREWEAVTKFFKEFSLPLPEIPLLTPEFQLPLFLLLFCKAFQGKGGKKPKKAFRGHEGATHIFEKYVDTVSRKIENKFRIDHGPNKNIWDTIIEPIAAKMVSNNNDRLADTELIGLIKKSHPAVRCDLLLAEIEKNFLLIKVPRYSLETRELTGFDYRFPFQKFSDHLIGRYLFKKFEKEFGKSNKNLNTASKFFSKKRKLGKFLEKGWNRGIIEALFIQNPEQLKGIEFFEVAPYLNSQISVEAFIESIIWRRPNAFSGDLKTALEFINKRVISSEFGHANLLNAFLSVASVPGHPFNARFLHKHLQKTPMPQRDAWWSTFLHKQRSEKGAVDRLIEWGWSGENKSHISNESITLCATVLIWFLTTPNRFVRDKATKALVELLAERIDVLASLLETFRGVDDSYVQERLYAVAYGCVLRNKKDKNGLRKIAYWFYKNNFKGNKPPVNILTRDYARGVIEVARQENLIRVDAKKITPPYKTKWPHKVPSEKYLRKKYYPVDFLSNKTEERGFLDIWSSVMHNFGSLGDFGRYEVDSALGHWSGRMLRSKEISKRGQFEKFKKGLTKKQLELLNKIDPFFGVKLSRIIKFIDVEGENKISEEELKKQERISKLARLEKVKLFKKSLSKSKLRFYNEQIVPFRDESGRINDPLERFDSGLGQRWIFNRVIELGWNPKLHGTFDRNVNYDRADRSEHKPERIGKKYQWIALHEPLALVADNFQFKGDSWSDTKDVYQGPWQLSIRDIDPSCLLKTFPNKKPDDIPIFNAANVKYNAWEKRAGDSTWLKQKKALPDPRNIIELKDGAGTKWVVFEGILDWEQKIPPEQERYRHPTRRLWYMIKSYLVSKKDAANVHSWAKDQHFMGRWMPESHEFYNIFLGEYPDSLAFLSHYTPYYHHDGWTNGSKDNRIPGKILVTDDQYQSSGSSIDCSTDETINVKLGAKFIINKMKLSQKYVDGRFYDSKNNLVAFDPVAFGIDTPRRLLFRKDKLLGFLKKYDLDIFWTVLGEKNLIGGGGVGQPLGWLEINGAYKLDSKKKISGELKSEFKIPR